MRTFVNAAVAAVSLTGFTWAAGQAPQEPKHLTDVRALLKKIDLSKTGYEHGKSRISFSAPVECYCDCSGLIDGLLIHSYGYNESQFKAWFDSKRPSAARFHDAIVEQKGFTRIPLVKSTLPGDILAIKYFERKDNTGHVMIVTAAPQKMAAQAPTVAGTEQWQVKVIDSSRSGHGNTDTRYKKGPDGKDHEGLGEGVFRIYADKQGKVAGFAWSTLTASKFVEPAKEELVIGRLKAGFKP